MDYTKLAMMAAEVGFTHTAPLNAATITLHEEVRDMCASGKCGQYGNNWSCPPHCGSLEDCRNIISKYSFGILVQTVGQLEDCFDAESMWATEKLHKENFRALHEILVQQYPNLLPLSAGCCTQCKECCCPDEPCRFPGKQFSSMEAYGILVHEACSRNNMAYYYGSDCVAYTSCFLLE